MKVTLLLVDDHPMFRKGIRDAIAGRDHLVLLGEASSAAEALKLAEELKPELVIMDIHLPDLSGIEATRRLLIASPSAKILIFSGNSTRALVDEALHAGACGYILKTGAVEELVDAIETVMAGKLYLSRELSAGILEDYRTGLNQEAKPAKPLLSDRDKQLLRLVAEGRRNKEIAAELEVSVKSVEAFRSRLMKKLDCSSMAELVRYAIREGIGPS